MAVTWERDPGVYDVVVGRDTIEYTRLYVGPITAQVSDAPSIGSADPVDGDALAVAVELRRDRRKPNAARTECRVRYRKYLDWSGS